MKKPFLLLGLCAVFMMTLFVSADAQTKPAGANFAGTWVLDKAKSELSPMMRNFDSITWIITQDDKQLTREQKFEGGRGGMMGNVPLTVKLDGSEASTDAPAISGKRIAKSNWQGNGKILEVNVVTTGSFQGNDTKQRPPSTGSWRKEVKCSTSIKRSKARAEISNRRWSSTRNNGEENKTVGSPFKQSGKDLEVFSF
jgi:hypothetical protein